MAAKDAFAFFQTNPTAAYSVTPDAGVASIIASGGSFVMVIEGSPNGGFITNPATAADQGLVTAEPLYVDPVNGANLAAGGTTFRLEPGETWTVIPGQTTPTTVNAATTGHKFSVIKW